MTLQESINKLRRLTNTNSSDYTDVEATFDIQQALEWAFSQARKAGGLTADDPTYTTLAKASFVLDGSGSYAIVSDATGRPITAIQNLALDDVPTSDYQLIGNSVVFGNATSGTASFYYSRSIDDITVADLPNELPLPRELQQVAYKLPALEYKFSKGLTTQTDVENTKESLKREIQEYYSTRRGSSRITPHVTASN